MPVLYDIGVNNFLIGMRRLAWEDGQILAYQSIWMP
jgi:hypothetical protein